MGLFERPLLQIEEADLHALIANEEAEGKTLDYKRDLVGRRDEERKEFLYDASSFANALGGDILFGMEEENGFPTKLVGLAGIDPDKEILRLEQLIRDGIRPALSSVRTVPIPLANGSVAIIMRIPRSWNPPHQVTFQKAFRFYGRDTNGKYQLDVDELRSVFSLSADVAERVRLFRIERMAKIVAGDGPLELGDSAKMVTHILPLAAFAARVGIDINVIWRDPTPLIGLLGTGGTPSFNIDGVWLGSRILNGSRYVQTFRDGCIEVVSCFSRESAEARELQCPAFEHLLITQLRHAKRLFRVVRVEPPIVILLSLSGMKDWRISTGLDGSAARFDRDPVFIPEQVLETFDGVDGDDVKPTLDCVWNAAGSPHSPNYLADGRRRQDNYY